MDLLKQVVKQICVLYAKSFLVTVCLIVTGVLLLGIYTASDMGQKNLLDFSYKIFSEKRGGWKNGR